MLFFSWRAATGPSRGRLGLGLLATAAALAACAPVGEQQANQPQTSARRADVAAADGLRWGMPRAEVDTLIGQPDGMQQAHGEVVYQYLVRPAPGRGDGRADYYAIFRDDRLAGWGTGRVRTVPGPAEASLVVETLVGGAHPPPRAAGRLGPAPTPAPAEVAGSRPAAGPSRASKAREEEASVASYRVAGPVAASVTTVAAGSDEELPGAVEEAVLEPGAGALVGRRPSRGDPSSPILPVEEEGPPPAPQALAPATVPLPGEEPSARGMPELEDREAGPLRKMLAGVRRRMETR